MNDQVYKCPTCGHTFSGNMAEQWTCDGFHRHIFGAGPLHEPAALVPVTRRGEPERPGALPGPYWRRARPDGSGGGR